MADTARQHGEQGADLPVTAEALLARLTDMGISYDLHRHKPVFSVSESAFLYETILGTHCRNLFLRDKKKRSYLIVAADRTRIDLKKLPGLIGSDRLSFGSAERLWQSLGVRPGSVCPFAVVNDTDNAVTIILDQSMMTAEQVNFHPMENHMTVGLAPADLVIFIESCGHAAHIIDLTGAAPDEED